MVEQTDQSIDRRRFGGWGCRVLFSQSELCSLPSLMEHLFLFFFNSFLCSCLFVFLHPCYKNTARMTVWTKWTRSVRDAVFVRKKNLLIFNVPFGFSSSCGRIMFLLHFQVTNIWKKDLLWSRIMEKKKESKNGTDLFCVRDACIFLFFICLHHPMNPLRCKNVILQRGVPLSSVLLWSLPFIVHVGENGNGSVFVRRSGSAFHAKRWRANVFF